MDIFMVTFREALEAALIVGLIFSMLTAFGIEKKRKRFIFLGVFGGIIFSFLLAYVFTKVFGEFEGAAEKIYEGSLMLLACMMITHFIIWTNNHFSGLGNKIKNTIEKVITSGEMALLTTLAFVSVLREGVETVIFLKALDFSFDSSDIYFALGGSIGAVVLAIVMFHYIKTLNIMSVIKTTNILFIAIAGGLLAHSIVEFQGAGLLPTFIKPLFDLSPVLPETQGLGALLKAGFSYDANPSLLAFIAYIGYIGALVYILYCKKPKKSA